MKTALFPTQKDDIAQMLSKEDLPNFSEPGTGKTLTTVGYIEQGKFNGGVIAAPVVALGMWKDVLENELGAKCQILTDKHCEIDPLSDFRILSYRMLQEFYAPLMGEKNDILVCDESQYLKSSTAQRTQAIFGPDCSGLGGIYETCLQCIQLSGTPIERYADDLWSQLRATQPEALQKAKALSLHNFQLQFCRMEDKEYGATVKRVSTANMNERMLNKLLYKDIGVVRRVMEDVAEFMPPITTSKVSIELSKNRTMDEFLKTVNEKDIEAMLEGGDEGIATVRRVLGIAKLKEGSKYIAGLARQEPVLVGFWHTDVGENLVVRLKQNGFKCGYIDGAISGGQRDIIKKKFMRGDIDVIVGQISAMGVAMDGLQKAGTKVVFLEDEFAPSKVEQFMKRIWRLGQEKSVHVDFLKAIDNPIDDAIERIRKRKATGIVKILNAE